MIDDWRSQFHVANAQTDPEFPFGFVQLNAVGAPNLTVGSPCGLFKYCVHPQHAGAVAVTEAFWELYFGRRNAPPVEVL